MQSIAILSKAYSTQLEWASSVGGGNFRLFRRLNLRQQRQELLKSHRKRIETNDYRGFSIGFQSKIPDLQRLRTADSKTVNYSTSAPISLFNDLRSSMQETHLFHSKKLQGRQRICKAHLKCHHVFGCFCHILSPKKRWFRSQRGEHNLSENGVHWATWSGQNWLPSGRIWIWILLHGEDNFLVRTQGNSTMVSASQAFCVATFAQTNWSKCFVAPGTHPRY